MRSTAVEAAVSPAKNCSSVAVRRSIWRLLPYAAGCGLSGNSQLRKGAWLRRSFTLSTTTISVPIFLDS